jgi:hypothetical protein
MPFFKNTHNRYEIHVEHKLDYMGLLPSGTKSSARLNLHYLHRELKFP